MEMFLRGRRGGRVLPILSDWDNRGILWVWNFRFQDFGGGAVFAVVPAHPGRVVLRIKYKQTLFWSFIFRVTSFRALRKFLRLGKSAWDFLGVNFWARKFFGFWLFHLIIPVTWNLEYTDPPTPREMNYVDYNVWGIVSYPCYHLNAIVGDDDPAITHL